jgi:hypothetical protein
MTEHDKEMQALLEARIAFRRQWINRFAYRKPVVTAQHLSWLEEIDADDNMARVGAEFVDAEWGLPKPKAKPRKRADKVRAFAVAA